MGLFCAGEDMSNVYDNDSDDLEDYIMYVTQRKSTVSNELSTHATPSEFIRMTESVQ